MLPASSTEANSFNPYYLPSLMGNGLVLLADGLHEGSEAAWARSALPLPASQRKG
jgi:hypothetical protein